MTANDPKWTLLNRLFMNKYLIASLMLILTACGGSSSDSNEEPTDNDFVLG